MDRNVARIRCQISLVVALATAGWSAVAFAQGREPESPDDPENAESRVTSPDAAGSGDLAESGDAPESSDALDDSSVQRHDPCAVAGIRVERSWVDSAGRWLEHTVCSSADWFDRKFGEDRLIDDYGTSGYVIVGGAWNERDGFDDATRMRVRVDLPRFEGRVNAMFGRDDRESAVRESVRFDDRTHLLEGNDAEWLVGLGYRPAQGDRFRFDVDGGIELDYPPNPYVRARARTFRLLSDRGLARFGQTVFWEAEEGLGATASLSLEHLLRRNRLIRWQNRGTFSESTEGLDWRSELGWFVDLSSRSALAVQFEVHGKTRAEVKIERYLLRFRYRRPFHRDWLFYEVRPAVVWPREFIGETREPTLELGLRIEMAFGARARSHEIEALFAKRSVTQPQAADGGISDEETSDDADSDDSERR